MPPKDKKVKRDKDSEEYILENIQPKRFGLTFKLIILVIIITAIAIIGVIFDYW